MISTDSFFPNKNQLTEYISQNPHFDYKPVFFHLAHEFLSESQVNHNFIVVQNGNN
jgi:hypothetical protein